LNRFRSFLLLIAQQFLDNTRQIVFLANRRNYILIASRQYRFDLQFKFPLFVAANDSGLKTMRPALPKDSALLNFGLTRFEFVLYNQRCRVVKLTI